MSISSLLLVLSVLSLCLGKESYFLLLSDIHYDPHYVELSAGGETGDWCRKHLPVPESSRAIFGRNECNPGMKLVESTITTIKTATPSPSFILLAGDLASHALYTEEEVISVINDVTSLIASSFPNVPIYSTIGNNDLFPSYQSIDLQALAKVWGPHFQSKEAFEQFSQTGYYKADIPGTQMTLISINSVLYSPSHKNALSYFSAENSGSTPDPLNQFEWLKNQLILTHKQNRAVLLLTHIPPGNNEFRDGVLWQEFFTKKFVQIIELYGKHIIAQFYGHLHADDYRIVTSSHAPGFISASVSPVYANNPAFRVVKFDSEQSNLIDIDTYYMDLFTSNKEKYPHWYFEYSFKNLYSVPDLSISSLTNLISKISVNETYWNNFINSRSALFYPRRFAYVCAMKYMELSDFRKCLSENSDEYPLGRKRIGIF
ncbi:hypothetical protein RCL1_006435 [Eukaryota sp. TZLM3-RCL]